MYGEFICGIPIKSFLLRTIKLGNHSTIQKRKNLQSSFFSGFNHMVIVSKPKKNLNLKHAFRLKNSSNSFRRLLLALITHLSYSLLMDNCRRFSRRTFLMPRLMRSRLWCPVFCITSSRIRFFTLFWVIFPRLCFSLPTSQSFFRLLVSVIMLQRKNSPKQRVCLTTFRFGVVVVLVLAYIESRPEVNLDRVCSLIS